MISWKVASDDRANLSHPPGANFVRFSAGGKPFTFKAVKFGPFPILVFFSGHWRWGFSGQFTWDQVYRHLSQFGARQQSRRSRANENSLH